MSVRSTTASGAVLFGEGYDGAPAELDPMGGNAGLSNPYIEVNPPPIQPDTPFLPIYDPFDGLRINGQRVGCNLDGISIGCSQAFAALESGSAIPANIGEYQSTVSGLGIGGTFTEITGMQDTGNFCTNGVCPSGPLNVNAPQSTVIFVPGSYDVSWNLVRQTQPQSQPLPQQTLTIKDIIDEAKRVIRETPSCRNIFAADVDSIKLLEDFEKGIIGNISFGALVSPPGSTINAKTIATVGPGIPYFTDTGTPVFQNGKQLKTSPGVNNVNITFNNILSSPGRERYGLNTLQDRVVTLIHELGHAANFIRNNFANANPTASAILDDDITRPAVSQNNSDFVNANCFGALSRLTQTGVIQ